MSEQNIQTARNLIASLSALDIDGMRPFLDDHVVMELPYAPEGIPQRTEGVDAVLDILRPTRQTFDVFKINIHEAYDCPSRDMVIMEATGMGKKQGGGIYQNRYVLVFGYKGGKINLWREFFDPSRI